MIRAVTVPAVVDNLTATPAATEPIVEPTRDEIVAVGSFEEINERFLAERWSDGLPIVPPTAERIGEFLAHTERAADEVLGVVLPDSREVTVWSLAANGVMAGCRPEYMPVLVALGEAMADPAYGVEHSGNTPGSETLITVNGPIARRLELNCGQGALREATLADGRLAAIRRFDIQAAGLLVHGSIAAGGGEGSIVERVELGRLKIGERTDVRGSVVRRPDGGFDITATGASFDGEAFVAGDTDSVADNKRDKASLPPLRLNARLDRLWVGPKSAIRGAAIKADYDGARWQRIEATGRTPEGSGIAVRYGENVNGQTLDLRSPDAGAVLRTLGVVDNITGGRLVLKASKAGRTQTAPWRGDVMMTEFSISKAPILARLLSVASLTGIADLALGKGLGFNRLDLPFELRGERLTITKARAVGSQIGITADGEIELEKAQARLEGVVVPAYTLNTLVGRIPILGDIITGGDGGGVFAADYVLSGPLAKPKIKVSPLTALAPGFLRGLLRGLGKAGAGQPPPESQADQ